MELECLGRYHAGYVWNKKAEPDVTFTALESFCPNRHIVSLVCTSFLSIEFIVALQESRIAHAMDL